MGFGFQSQCVAFPARFKHAIAVACHLFNDSLKNAEITFWASSVFALALSSNYNHTLAQYTPLPQTWGWKGKITQRSNLANFSFLVNCNEIIIFSAIFYPHRDHNVSLNPLKSIFWHSSSPPDSARLLCKMYIASHMNPALVWMEWMQGCPGRSPSRAI